MIIEEEYSIRNTKEQLLERGALEACKSLARQFEGDPSKNNSLRTDLGFPDSTVIEIGDNRPQFDAYSKNWKVGIEREMQQQMNVRSHLLFTEMAFQIGKIEIGVYILPMENNGKAQFTRTKREISEYKIFTKYFPLTVPLYLIGVKSL